MVCEMVWIFRMNVDLMTLEMIPLTITHFTTSLSFNKVLTTFNEVLTTFNEVLTTSI